MKQIEPGTSFPTVAPCGPRCSDGQSPTRLFPRDRSTRRWSARPESDNREATVNQRVRRLFRLI